MPDLQATGFFSYARDDDRNASGRLSQLRALLKSELETQLGRIRVNLFQDVAMIDYGDLWKPKIEQTLPQCSFLIPILDHDRLRLTRRTAFDHGLGVCLRARSSEVEVNLRRWRETRGWWGLYQASNH